VRVRHNNNTHLRSFSKADVAAVFQQTLASKM